MFKPIFGDLNSIAELKTKRRSKPKFKQLEIAYDQKVEAIDYKLCKICSKKEAPEIISISDLFKFICESCKEGICEIVNNKMIIGALVRPIKINTSNHA